MKHILFILLLVVVGLSCKKSPTSPLVINEDPGEVSFQLLKRTIPSDVALIKVTLERGTGSVIEDSVSVATPSDTVSLLMENIPVGTWNLTVRAKDASGIVRYVGSASVTIYSGQTTNVAVFMEPVDSGTGLLFIHVFWGKSACTPQPEALIGWWKGNGTPEDSKSGLHGSFVGGAMYDSGVVGTAFSFTGSNYLEVPDTLDLDLISSFSIALWFKLNVPLEQQPDFLGPSWNDFPMLVEKGDGGFMNRNYGVYFDKWQNKLLFNAIDTSRTTAVFSAVVPGVNVLVDDLQWHFLAVVWNADTRVASILIDGVLRDVAEGTDAPMRPNDEALKFGAAGAGEYYFDGTIDEILLVGAPLDAESIQKIYQSGSKGLCP
jgi:hypothetical protein